MEGLSSSDVALLSRDGDAWGGGAGFFWVFALLLLNNGGFGGWGGNAAAAGLVTQADLAASQNAQTQQLQMAGLSEQIANNKFDIAQVIHEQTDTMINQNNANMINAIQGFNNLGVQITNQTNTLAGQLMQLGAKLDSCCCEIKTQMLQDKLQEARDKNVQLENALNNANQSQYILGQLGRFVAWAGTGSQAGTVAGG